jgi:RND family efflux transporter MFP subunit
MTSTISRGDGSHNDSRNNRHIDQSNDSDPLKGERMTTAQHTSAIVAIALILAACAKPPAESNVTPLVSVAAATVTIGDVAQPVVATGTFGPRDEIPLAFKIGGVISRIAVDAGQTVQKGQLLASLDLREIDAMLDKAKVGVDKAERDQARIRRLAADSVATLAQLQDATSALDAARADAQSARVNREYASIVAPEQGVVLLKSATAGSNIAAGTTVLLLGGGARGRVLHVGLPDRDALRVRLGDAATVSFNAIADRRYHGKVTLRGQSADARTGTYALEITLTDAAELPAGLVGRVEIAVTSSARATMIPVDALLEANADSATVYTLNNDPQPTATAHRVRITQLVGDRAAVTGLDDHARVVTRGAPYVVGGAKVRVVSTPSTATAAVVSQATNP